MTDHQDIVCGIFPISLQGASLTVASLRCAVDEQPLRSILP